MGFWGSEILARSKRPLDELDAITSRDQGIEEIVRFADDWQWTQVSGEAIVNDAEGMLRDLVRETGSPALTGYVLDSDCIDLVGWAPQSGLWRACLSRSAMAGYLADEAQSLDSVYLPPAQAAERALNWAQEAGLTPDRVALRELFRQDDDAYLLTGFCAAVGIRRPEPPVPQFTAGTVEARLAEFVDEFVAPRLLAAGWERDPAGAYPPDPGGHILGRRSGRDCVRLGLHPFDPGFVLQLSVDWAGRLDLPHEQSGPLSWLQGALLGVPPERLLKNWRHVWRTASAEIVRTLPTAPGECALTADGVQAAADEMVRAAQAVGQAEALIDIIHSHGSGHWFWDRTDGQATVPAPLLELAVVGFHPSFALDEALLIAEGFSQTSGGLAIGQVVEEFAHHLRLQGVDNSFRVTAQLVRERWHRLLEEFVVGPLLARGFLATEHGYELTSPVGDRVLIDLELSATSTPDRVCFYVHAGLLSTAQTEWDQDWAGRFNKRPEPPRRAMFGWFSAAPRPRAGFDGGDNSMQQLGLRPWCFTPDSIAECGRALAGAIQDECDRLEPLLDVDRMLAALADDEGRIAKTIMALLPHGPSAALMENLQLAGSSADPFIWEMAAWARARLTGSS